MTQNLFTLFPRAPIFLWTFALHRGSCIHHSNNVTMGTGESKKGYSFTRDPYTLDISGTDYPGELSVSRKKLHF